MSEIVEREFDDAAMALRAFNADPTNAARVEDLSRVCAESIKAGGKILAVGNGGSCADAMHFCEELTGRYRDDRPPIPAIACVDPGHLTCTANDYGFEQVFSRWVEGLGREGDVLVAMSTSGNSANIVRGVEAAKNQSLHVALLLGKDGGKLKGCGEFEWIAPGVTSDRIQEIHMLVLHSLVGAIERAMGYAE